MARQLIIGVVLIALLVFSCTKETITAAEQTQKDFERNVTAKQQELREEYQNAKSREMLTKLTTSCEQKCADATTAGCSAASMTTLCTFSSQNVFPGSFIDLNGDSTAGSGALRGTVCEEKIYCHNVVESCCGAALTRERCTGIVSDYYLQNGFGAQEVGPMLDAVLGPGSCPQ